MIDLTKGERVGLIIERISLDAKEVRTPKEIAKLRGATKPDFVT